MINEKTKKMTISELAVLMKAGFVHVEELITKEVESLAISTANHFSRIEDKIDGVETKIEKIDKRLDDMSENRVKYIDHDELKKRVRILEAKS